MNDDLEYVKSLENEVDELESEKADFSNIYDLLLEEYVSKMYYMFSYLAFSVLNLNANTIASLYLYKVKECECLAQKLSKQTELTDVKQSQLDKKMIQLYLERSEKKIMKYRFEAQMQYLETCTKQNREPQLPHASRNTNPQVSKSTGVIHTTSVSRPQLKCYQVKDKFTKKEVEDHHRISSISKNNESSNSRTSNVNVVCAECGKCVFNSNHDACVSRYLNDVNARTKNPKVVPISANKPKRKANKSVATPHKKTVASDTTIQKPKSFKLLRSLYEE
ncbi:hypothetical protein Tco_0273492 [Tanacetum coccineum]